MESEKPFITKRPHTKSRNGCHECKRRKQKCDEVQPKCQHCKKRNVECKYGPRLTSRILGTTNPPGIVVEELGDVDDSSLLSKLSSLDSSSSDSCSSESTGTASPERSIASTREIARNDFIAIQERAPLFTSIPNSLEIVPWQNGFEHQMYKAYCVTHRESMTKPGMDDATREIWLNLVPKIAVNSQGALFALLLSLGSMHTAIKSGDYPYLRKGSKAARLWDTSMRYFSDAIKSFRNSITTGQVFKTNPEVFCVTALVLSFRTSLNANHRHTDAESLYEDTLAWFSSTLGYIDVGGFYAVNLQNTQLGRIMKDHPGATYHFFPFLEFIMSQDFPYFDYLHPKADSTGNVDPEDSTDEALHAYTMSIKLIGWVYQAAAIQRKLKADIFAMFHMVPYTVPKHFLVLLRQRRPRAIAILAHHISLLAFLGIYEHLHFWSREHITLLSELVPQNWIWALKKALQVVEEAEKLRSNTA